MNQRINVLLIEDDADYVMLMGQHLNEACGNDVQFKMECAERLQNGLHHLSREYYDIILLDLMLPDSQGLETLRTVREHNPTTPVVVLTGLGDEDNALMALSNGAQDYLVKESFDSRLLRRAISYAIERNRMQGGLEAIIANAADGMIVIAQGVVQYANPAALALLGQNSAQLIGKPFLRPDTMGHAAEMTVPIADGGERVLEVRTTEFDWRRAHAKLVTLRDLTEHRKVEQMKTEITERKRLDKLKDQFMSVVSHEIRSPLTVIRAAIANLKEGLAGDLNSSQNQLVTMAYRNVERLSRIINNILDLSRLESGKATIRRQRVKALRLARETLQGFQLSHSSEKQITLHDDMPQELPDAFADPDMVIQIVTNLLDNALRFARSNVWLSASNDDGYLKFSIRDDGPGVPKDKIGDLFNKFVQINRPAGGGSYKGTGLGLALCQEMVHLHEGRIWIENGHSRGCTFHFTMPEYETYRAKMEEAASRSKPADVSQK